MPRENEKDLSLDPRLDVDNERISFDSKVLIELMTQNLNKADLIDELWHHDVCRELILARLENDYAVAPQTYNHVIQVSEHNLHLAREQLLTAMGDNVRESLLYKFSLRVAELEGERQTIQTLRNSVSRVMHYLYKLCDDDRVKDQPSILEAIEHAAKLLQFVHNKEYLKDTDPHAPMTGALPMHVIREDWREWIQNLIKENNDVSDSGKT